MPPKTIRTPGLLAFSLDTSRASAYVAPPIMNMMMSCGLKFPHTSIFLAYAAVTKLTPHRGHLPLTYPGSILQQMGKIVPSVYPLCILAESAPCEVGAGYTRSQRPDLITRFRPVVISKRMIHKLDKTRYLKAFENIFGSGKHVLIREDVFKPLVVSSILEDLIHQLQT